MHDDHSDGHHHHGHHPEPETYAALRTKAIESLLAEKGLISTDAIDLRALIDARKRKRFLKKVFKKDEAHFDASIDTLNAMTSWKEASVFIDEIFIMNDVDPFSKDAIRFTDLVYSRFFPASSESREEEVSVPPPEDE